MSCYQVVGKGVPKVDAQDKVIGRTRYGADITEPRVLTARILHSPHPHALIRGIDASKAQGLPGVRAVVTAQDAPDVRIGRWIQDRHILARDKVRYQGEAVAAVAAVDEDTAQQALDLIQVDYEPLPGVFTPLEALQPQAPLIHERLAEYTPRPPRRKTSGNIVNQARIIKGNPEKAMAEAEVLYEAEYSTPRWHQGFLEPHACVAFPEAGGKVVLWASTKAPFEIRETVAEALGLPLSRVRVVSSAIGGEFGGKGSASIEPIVALLALKAGCPVKLVLSRQEELTATYIRSGSYTQMKMGARRDGTIHALQVRAVFDSGAYFDSGAQIPGRAVMFCGPYEIPNLDLELIAVYTNNIPSGHTRGPYGPQAAFAIESHVDGMARKLGMDPLELRRRNLVKEGSVLVNGALVHNVGLAPALAKVADYLGKHQPSPPKAHCGWGIACAHWHQHGLPGSLPASSAQVKMNEDGTLTLLTANPDSGGGQHTIFLQIVSEVLRVPYGEINLMAADTDATTYDRGTGGQRTTYEIGMTVKLAAEDLRRQLLETASKRLGVSVDSLDVGKGRVFVKDSSEIAVSFADLYEAAAKGPGPMIGLSSHHREEALAEMVQAKGIADGPCYGVSSAQVEVDPETGQVKLLDYFAAFDVGFAVNPRNVEGQIEGGAAFGLGNALTERLLLAKGEVQNPSFHDYRMPTAADVSPMETALVELPSKYGPYGAKGLGEAVNQVVAPAIANAIAAATGVRVTELPITSERLLSALKSREEKKTGSA